MYKILFDYFRLFILHIYYTIYILELKNLIILIFITSKSSFSWFRNYRIELF